MGEALKVVVVDAQGSGASGDKLLAALFDLGADVTPVAKIPHLAAKLLRTEAPKLRVIEDLRGGVRGKRVFLEGCEGIAAGGMEGLRLLRIGEEVAEALGMSKRGKELALSSLKSLLEVEGRLHGAKGRKAIHLHELGSLDTLVDTLGFALALEDLGLLEAKPYCLPLALGGGRESYHHGSTGAPAPATLQLLAEAGLIISGGPIRGELTTPTGAALLRCWGARPILFFPMMRAKRIGYGLGTKELSGLPNLLRIVLGEEQGIREREEELCILEANLDDATGEVLGHALERLMGCGALDAHFIPVYGKKNRPGYMVRALCHPGDADLLAEVMMEETGTLGVRVLRLERHIRLRREEEISVEVGGRRWRVGVKVAVDSEGRPLMAKPEYEDAKRIAEELGKPLKWVLAALQAKVEERLLKP